MNTIFFRGSQFNVYSHNPSMDRMYYYFINFYSVTPETTSILIQSPKTDQIMPFERNNSFEISALSDSHYDLFSTVKDQTISLMARLYRNQKDYDDAVRIFNSRADFTLVSPKQN